MSEWERVVWLESGEVDGVLSGTHDSHPFFPTIMASSYSDGDDEGFVSVEEADRVVSRLEDENDFLSRNQAPFGQEDRSNAWIAVCELCHDLGMRYDKGLNGRETVLDFIRELKQGTDMDIDDIDEAVEVFISSVESYNAGRRDCDSRIVVDADDVRWGLKAVLEHYTGASNE